VNGTVVNTRLARTGLVIEVRGDVDVAATAALREALVRAVLRGRPTRVVVDLRKTVQLDAMAIGAIIAASQIATDRQLAMVIRAAQPTMAAQFAAAGMPRAQLQSRHRWPNSHFVFWLV
jgi:anti-anti-sigma factor